MIKEKVAGSEDFCLEITPLLIDLWAKEFNTDVDTLECVIEFMYEYSLLVEVDDGAYMPEFDRDLSQLRNNRKRQEQYRNKDVKKVEPVKEKVSKPKEKKETDPAVARIFKHNEEVCEKEMGFKPVVNYAITGNLIKKLLKSFDEETIKLVITEGYKEEVMVKFHLQNINKILSAQHFNRILGKTKALKPEKKSEWITLETPLTEELLEAIF